MVGVYTIEGDIRLNTSKFDSAIRNVTAQLETLTSMELGVTGSSMIGELETLKQVFRDIGTEAKAITESFAQIKGLNTLLGELETIKERIASIKNDVGQVQTKAQQTSTAFTKWNEVLATVSPNFQGMMHSMEAIQGQTMSAVAELGSLRVEEGTQIKKNLTYYEQELQVAQQFKNAEQGLIRGYVEQGQMLDRLIEKGAKRISQLEREMNQARNLGREYLKVSREQNRQLPYFERQQMELAQSNAELSKYWQTQERIIMANKQDDAILKNKATSIKSIIEMEGEELALYEGINALIKQGTADSIKQAEALTTQLNEKSELFALIQEQIALEKENLSILEMQDDVIKKQGVDRTKSMQGNKLDKFGYLPSRISSMAVTMLGYQEIMDVWNKTTANINAKTQFSSYADLLKTDNRYLKQTKQSTADVTKGINELNKALTDTYKGGKNLQQMYSKVDMRQVGANALDTAFKYGVQAENLDELTEVMAIYSSEFVRQGRSQEDSILAVNDALDGEFRRLKEVNIGKEDLEKRGYKEGDTLSLIRAMREIAEERGYDVTAQKITTLSEAINQAELELAFLVSDLFELAEPSLIYALGKIVELFRWLGKGVKQLKDYLQGLPQPTKDFLKVFGGNAMLGLVGLWIGRKIWGAVSNMSLFGGAWEKLMGKLGRTKGMDKATESMGKMGQTTGGTVSNTSAKDGLKNWGRNLAKNLGKMAEIFIEVAVAIAMAWALLKEAMWMIADIGKQWESQKAEFETGMDFLKSYGIWIIGISAVMVYFLNGMGSTPTTTAEMKNIARGGLKFAEGLAIAMGLIAEAIGLLILPMTAIALLGGTASFLGTNLDKGLEVISWIGNALHQMDLPMALFIGGFLAVSLLLGLVQPLTIGLAVGIASALLLVTEAIVMLIPPLGAIALLGGTASMLGEDNIKQGAETIAMIGRVLSVLADAMVDLVVVDLGVFADRVLNFATQLVNGGKDAMTTLTEDILPSLRDFIKDFNAMDFSVTIDSAKVQAVTTMAEQIPPMFRAVQKLTSSLGGGGFSVSLLGGLVELKSDSGLGSKLDALYEDIRAVMDFARKLGGLSTANGGANANAIQQTANAIAQLKVKLNLFITTISGASSRVQSASQKLGSALTTGFKTGSASFNPTVVSTLAKGISEVQSRYATWLSGGKASAQKLTDGFKTFGGKIRATIRTEMNYALRELESYQDDFYRKGQALGKQLSDGFESSGGLNVGSPANIARTIAKEMEYSMLALDNGKQLMYKGGQALGQALTNGYNSYGNLRTDVGVLASKGVNSEQLQANAKNVQANGKVNQQTPKIFAPTVNIDMSNSTIIGVQDLDARIRQSVDKAMIEYNSPNGAIGY